MHTSESETILRHNEQLLRRCVSLDQAVRAVPSLIVDPSGCAQLQQVSSSSSVHIYKLRNLADSVYFLPGFISPESVATLTEEILSNHIDSPPHSNSFSAHNDTPIRDSEQLLDRLRWSCVGYHYNWGERSYSPELKSDFPPSFEKIYRDVLDVINAVGVGELTGCPESAIINFYHSKRVSDRLGGHRDDVEKTDATPLVSLSMGLPGVFLIESEAIVLRSGDVVVMANSARQSLHGVPCILSGKRKRVEELFLEKTRISISIRQVYPEDV